MVFSMIAKFGCISNKYTDIKEKIQYIVSLIRVWPIYSMRGTGNAYSGQREEWRGHGVQSLLKADTRRHLPVKPGSIELRCLPAGGGQAFFPPCDV